MRCISPLSLRQNGSINVVPCGKCNFCLSSKRDDWSFRLRQELKVSTSASFITLTYATEKMPVNSSGLLELRKSDCQAFMKRLRKVNSVPLRFYTVGEYGTRTLRPHYHSILFNIDPEVRNKLHTIWQLGNVHVGDVSAASIHYVTKYVINRHSDIFAGREPPFLLCRVGPVSELIT